MLGVVIWRDEADSKAIIWCEDHGELAFLGQSPHKAASADRFDEGDLIQFDVTVLDSLRIARNPRRIAQHYCCDLSAVVSKATELKESLGQTSKPDPARPDTSNVATFDLDRLRAKRNGQKRTSAAAR
ncbi:MAG: hypothetical protein WBC85_08805 [Planktotalea sp.]|uniref:hypothetical protein n=1 Tax=Planktotalea sp. TaxID=2029877 RepID=UPI003C76B922